METYRGVKFACRSTGDTFCYDHRLDELNHWSWLLSQLGLAPVHARGAYGNASYRAAGNSFVITRAGGIPEKILDAGRFTLVTDYDAAAATFEVRGKCLPSSECFLHDRIYRRFDAVQAILHGHSALLNEWAPALGIPVTSEFCEYGTPELADSALATLSRSETVIILKEHGFVAVGESIGAAGRTILEKYRALLGLVAGSGWADGRDEAGPESGSRNH